MRYSLLILPRAVKELSVLAATEYQKIKKVLSFGNGNCRSQGSSAFPNADASVRTLVMMRRRTVGVWGKYMEHTIQNIRIYIFLISLLLTVVFLMTGAVFAKPSNTIFVGMAYARPHFSIDQRMDVEGKVVHFFTSRPIDYLGWYFTVARQVPVSDNFGYGYFFGLGFWQTGYWLNWEMPDYSVSLDPLKSDINIEYVSCGALLFRRLGPVKIVPFLSVPIGHSIFHIKIEDEWESGDAFYFGLSGGLEANLGLSKSIFLTFGYKTTMLHKSTRHYKVEKGVELEGKFNKMPQEFYGGLSFKPGWLKW